MWDYSASRSLHHFIYNSLLNISYPVAYFLVVKTTFPVLGRNTLLAIIKSWFLEFSVRLIRITQLSWPVWSSSNYRLYLVEYRLFVELTAWVLDKRRFHWLAFFFFHLIFFFVRTTAFRQALNKFLFLKFFFFISMGQHLSLGIVHNVLKMMMVWWHHSLV